MLVHADSRCGRGREIFSLSCLPAGQVSALGLWCVGHGQSCRKCCTIIIEDVPLGHIADSLAKVEIVNSFNVVDFFCFVYIHFIIPFGKFGQPYNQGKDTVATRATLPSPASACYVVSC